MRYGTSRPVGERSRTEVCNVVCSAVPFKNRGLKQTDQLSFLNNTAEVASLLEICFVNSKGDVNIYNARFNDICAAVARALPEKISAWTDASPGGDVLFQTEESVHSLVGQKILAYRLVRASRLFSMWMRLRNSFCRTSHLGLLDLPDGSTLGSTTWLVGGTTMLPPKRCCGTVGKELWSEAMGGNSSRGLPIGDRTETRIV